MIESDVEIKDKVSNEDSASEDSDGSENSFNKKQCLAKQIMLNMSSLHNLSRAIEAQVIGDQCLLCDAACQQLCTALFRWYCPKHREQHRCQTNVGKLWCIAQLEAPTVRAIHNIIEGVTGTVSHLCPYSSCNHPQHVRWESAKNNNEQQPCHCERG
jgi:hypothetical protein